MFFIHNTKHLYIMLLRYIIGDIEWQLIYDFIVYCNKDLSDLQYKLS